MYEPKKRITTICCDKARTHKTPHLAFIRTEDDYRKKLSERKPVWCVMARQTHKDMTNYEFEDVVEVDFCPFCGEKTPGIELNKTIQDKIYDTDSGDYCDTCHERSMCCECLPAEFRWQVSKRNINLNKLVC